MACHASRVKACVALHINEQIHTVAWLGEGPSRVAWRGDGGANRAVGGQRRAPVGEAGDAVDPRGLDGLGQRHGRQNGGQPPRQHGGARPRRADEEDVMVTTPASRSASSELLVLPSANSVDLLWQWEPR
jgi:hypothetical protein